MTEAEERDSVQEQLCARIEELEKGKLELNEQLDVAQEERDALAAHVEFCHKVMSMVENGPAYLVARQYRALRLARGRKPEASLARLKAKWQAEALEEGLRRMQGTCYGELRIEDYIEE